MTGSNRQIESRIPDVLTSCTVEVQGSRMHYLEVGAGDPIVFVHGNPTSSYLWRNVLPHAAGLGRCIAVDLIGMGRSGKPNTDYRLADHTAYLDGFIEALGLRRIAFVMHDWGVSLGLHYFARHPERVRAVAWMEGRLHPVASWNDFDEGGRETFKKLRTEGIGERMVIEENFFVETILPAGALRDLTQEEMDAYRAPYHDPSARWPILRWVEEIPIEGQPADVRQIVDGYREALIASSIPKLLLHGAPGALVGPDEVAWCREALSQLTAVDVGPGTHFLPEDRPHEIGRALAEWLRAVENASASSGSI